MKKLILFAVFIGLSITAVAQEDVTTYYLIRHAEKNRTDSSNRNPNLNTQGHKRAAHWATVFKTVSFDMIYSTDYNRTKQTAQPTADAQNVKLFVYNPSNMYSESFKHNTTGKNVLIVGHSNTTAAFANKILGEQKFKSIADNNNSNLYIITVTKDSATGTLLNMTL